MAIAHQNETQSFKRYNITTDKCVMAERCKSKAQQASMRSNERGYFQFVHTRAKQIM